jgi:hypothetical protein
MTRTHSDTHSPKPLLVSIIDDDSPFASRLEAW